MKKYLLRFISFALLFMILSPQAAYADTIFKVTEIGQEAKKVINIVYDDSGSMVNGDETDVSKTSAYVATWAQAKYSLEVFVAMMNVDDEINIYCMSDAGNKSKSIKGSDKNGGVNDIHSNLKTGDYSVLTPIQTLESAYNGLNDDKYDEYEKWLVVLTDGAFTISNQSNDKVSDSKVEALLYSYGENLKNNLIYIPIGSSADDYIGNTYNTYKASTGEEILNQIKIATETIYSNRDKEELTDTTVHLGVSMRKIIVFAQGSGVEIESISKGKFTDNISVKYTDAKNAVDYNSSKTTFRGNEDKIKTDESLQGVVATIEPNGDCIEPGQLNIIFGETIPKTYTIYYEPAVKVYYSLEQDGVEYLSSENETSGGSLNPGTYKLTAYIADAFQMDGDIPRNVFEAGEIQDVDFDIILSGTGVEGEEQKFSAEQLKNGVDVNLQRGEIECNANASILSGKYSVDTDALKNAFGGIKVKDTYRLEVKYELPTASLLSYRFSKTNFTLHSLKNIKIEKDMIKAVVTCYDNDNKKIDITDEQWSQVNLQTLNSYYDGNVLYDDNCYSFHIENGSGVFYLCPRYWEINDKSSKKKTTHSNYFKKKFCSVRHEVYIDVSDTLAYSTLGSSPEQKSTIYEISLCMWHTIISLIVFFWIFFCIFKKRLPKVKNGNLVNASCSKRKRNRRGDWEWEKAKKFSYDEPSTVYIKRKMSTVLIPFIPQKGEISLPLGLPKLKIEATEIIGNRSKVRLINSPADFESVSGKTTVAVDNLYLNIKGLPITKENLQSKKKKFEFSTTQSVISCGGSDGGLFKKYSLIFKKRKNKKGKKK